jgi:hypothetical protein
MRVLLRDWPSLVIATSLMVVGTSSRADLQIRVLRLKQINAAWEIVTGKRAQACALRSRPTGH